MWTNNDVRLRVSGITRWSLLFLFPHIVLDAAEQQTSFTVILCAWYILCATRALSNKQRRNVIEFALRACDVCSQMQRFRAGDGG